MRRDGCTATGTRGQLGRAGTNTPICVGGVTRRGYAVHTRTPRLAPRNELFMGVMLTPYTRR